MHGKNSLLMRAKNPPCREESSFYKNSAAIETNNVLHSFLPESNKYISSCTIERKYPPKVKESWEHQIVRLANFFSNKKGT